MSGPIAAILLAAGASRRFGADKLASRVTLGGRDASLIVHAVRPWLEVFDKITLVLRPESEALCSALLAQYNAARLDFVVCENAAQGMSTSLARGIEAEPNAGGWLIGLADMPRVPPLAISAVRDAISSGALLAAPYFGTERGHPVGFNRTYRDELVALSGDQGARTILQRDKALIQPIDVNDRGILLDIDKPADILGLH